MATRVSAVLRTGNVSCVTQEVTCVVLVTVASTNIIIFILSFFSGAAPSGEEGDMEISGRNSTSGLGGFTTLVGDAGGGSSTSSLGGFGGTAAEAPFVSSTVSFRKGGSWLHPYSGISVKDLTASSRHTKKNLMLKFRL